MDMSLMILEVDGSIRNPIVLAAVTIWCVPVALLASAAGSAAARRSAHLTARVVLMVLVTLACPGRRASARLVTPSFVMIPRLIIVVPSACRYIQ